MTILRKAAFAVAIAAAAVLGCAFQVNAADKGGPKTFEEIDITTKKPFSWTGMYIGAGAGYSVSDTELSIGGTSIKGFSGRGVVGEVQLGFDYHVPGSAVVIGARGGYHAGDVDFEVTSGANKFKVGIQDGWYVDGRLGVVMGTAMPYIFAGYTELKTGASLTGAPAIATPDIEGYRLGGGVEWRLNTKVMTLTPTLAFEYVYTNFDSVPLGGSAALDPTTHAAMVRLNLRFGTQ